MGSPKTRLQYLYDSRGNRRALIDQDGGRFTYTYDAVNRITQVINPQGDRTSYTYDAAGRRTLKRMANGTRASFSYDPAGNLTGLYNLKSNGDVISSFDYQYDRVGNRTAVLEADGSRVTWSYDATYQLTGEHRTGTTPYEDTYSYDQVGNRLTKVHDGARTTYSYDAANQLEWSEDSSGRTTYTFDADGNQQVTLEPTGDRTTNTWDYENRMTRVELPSGIRNTMAYEPGGLRVKLEESTGTKKFVWDKQNYLAETDENDDTQVVYTNEPRLYGNLISQRRGTDTHWYHFDAIGSTRELTDASAVVAGTRLYDAWGRTTSITGNTSFVFNFVGQIGYILDLDVHRYNVRNRVYIPAFARWLSLDPAMFIDGPNRYLYVDNSPGINVDPSGLGGNEFYTCCGYSRICITADYCFLQTDRYSQSVECKKTRSKNSIEDDADQCCEDNVPTSWNPGCGGYSSTSSRLGKCDNPTHFFVDVPPGGPQSPCQLAIEDYFEAYRGGDGEEINLACYAMCEICLGGANTPAAGICIRDICGPSAPI